MPIYAFKCEDCGTEFEEMRLFKNYAAPATCSCGGCGDPLFSMPSSIIFTDPRDTSKWDNFGYRAGFNMEKAKQERRDAEQASRQPNPYQEIQDCNLRDVFAPGGTDIPHEETPGLAIPE